MTSERRADRLPATLEVEYGTAGAFLVAYSLNLSTGGLFVETPTPHAVGTQLALRFTIPTSPDAVAIEVDGSVAWVREQEDEGRPPGMGIRFSEPVDQRYGDVIDRMASAFRGLRVIVVSSSPGTRSLLARGIRSILGSAIIVEASDSTEAEAALAEGADIVLVDLDDSGAEGLLALRLAKLGSRAVPVVAVARDERTRLRAGELGADEVLTAATAVGELQTSVLRALGRPVRVA